MSNSAVNNDGCWRNGHSPWMSSMAFFVASLYPSTTSLVWTPCSTALG